jgi:hypothetical protein
MTSDYQDHLDRPREDVRENDEDDTDPLEAALAELHQTNLRYIEAAQKFTDAAVSLIATIKQKI